MITHTRRSVSEVTIILSSSIGPAEKKRGPRLITTKRYYV